MSSMRSSKGYLMVLGVILGIGMAVLAATGNPGNMALCTICFIRDAAGALGLHSAEIVQYFRPEIVGIVLGAFILAIATQRFNLQSGSAPGARFVLGLVMGIFGLVFLGCTLRMLLRMAAGDISGYVGFAGFILGSAVGIYFLKKGFTMGEGNPVRKGDSAYFPSIILILFILFLTLPSLFNFSTEGPGSMHAPIILSLVVGLVFGVIGHETNFCLSGSLRSIMTTKDFTAALPIIGVFLTMLVYNIFTGNFSFQAYGPIAHAQTLWNFLPMFGMGIASALAGGCPVRQLFKASTGSGDGLITFLGILVGTAMAHNFGLAASAASPEAVGGPATAGKVAVLIGIVVVLVIGYWGASKSQVEESKAISAAEAI